MEPVTPDISLPRQCHSGRTLLEVTRDFFAKSPRELPVSKGEIVKYIGQDREWIQVKTTDGFFGFIPARFVRSYDAKKIRQRRKQAYAQSESREKLNLQQEETEKVSLTRGKTEKENAYELKDFINTAVSEALTKMAVDNKKNMYPSEASLISEMSVEKRAENKHAQGVCGRSCRLCYSTNGLRKPGTAAVKERSSQEALSEDAASKDAPIGYSQQDTAAQSNKIQDCHTKSMLSHKDYNATKSSGSSSLAQSPPLVMIQEDQSDSGIGFTHADEWTMSQCSCDLDSCKSNISDEDKSNRALSPASPLERYLGINCKAANPKGRKLSKNFARDDIDSASCVCGNDLGQSVLVLRNFLREENEDLTVWKGDIVTIIDDAERDWIWVRDMEGIEGYIPRAYASDDSCRECQSLLKERLRNRTDFKQEDSSLSRLPREKETKLDTKSEESKGVRFYVIGDHSGEDGNTISAKVGDVVIANMKEQLIDGWIWVYSARDKVSGYLPESILLEADPIEISEV